MENELLNDERVAKMDADQFYQSKGGKYLKGIDIAGQFLAGTTLLAPGARTCFKLTSTTLF